MMRNGTSESTVTHSSFDNLLSRPPRSPALRLDLGAGYVHSFRMTGRCDRMRTLLPPWRDARRVSSATSYLPRTTDLRVHSPWSAAAGQATKRWRPSDPLRLMTPIRRNAMNRTFQAFEASKVLARQGARFLQIQYFPGSSLPLSFRFSVRLGNPKHLS